MKKKIIAFTLVIAMLAICFGATLAYFTDADQNTNEFVIGNVSIDLYENVAHVDAQNKNKLDDAFAGADLGKGDDTNPMVAYTNILPGDVMTKKVTVDNTGSSDAYVAVAVKMADLVNFQQTLEAKYDDAQMEELVKKIFTGADWNMTHGKTNPNVSGNTMRFVPTTVVEGDADYRDATATTLISIDAVKKCWNEGQNQYFINYHLANMFGKDDFGYISTDSSLTRGYTVYPYSDDPTHTPGSHHLVDFQESAVYADELVEGEQIWVFYYFLPAGASVTLDLSMTCPTEITSDTIAAFEGIDLDIRATAIQVDGFATAKEAFTELNKTYDFSF